MDNQEKIKKLVLEALAKLRPGGFTSHMVFEPNCFGTDERDMFFRSETYALTYLAAYLASKESNKDGVLIRMGVRNWVFGIYYDNEDWLIEQLEELLQ